MKKLKLDHETLRVETFEPAEPTEGRGTVFGQTGQDTCHNTGCNSGLSSTCNSDVYTDCPGLGDCPYYTAGWTCNRTECTAYACTGCWEVC